jgi:KTSC domain
MTMTPVKSTNLHSLGYDPEAKLMRVKFRSGATHEYTGVPAAAHQAFLTAPSLGSHFANHVRGKYPSTKL